MNSSIARRFLSAIEPLVAMIYIAPEAAEEYEAIGLDAFEGYFTSRSAAMGRASAATVTSVFYVWSPDLVARSLPWDRVDPADVTAARMRAVRRAYERLLAEADGSLPSLGRAVELLKIAAAACIPEGRTLFAAHAGLPWPEEEPLAFFHGCNLLREYRGDGHIAALLTHGVRGVEAVVMHPPYRDAKADFLYTTRSWGDEAYAAARARLAERGFMTPEGTLTDGGVKFREMIELETDRLAMAPFEALGPERCEELLEILQPLAARVYERRGLLRSIARLARVPTA